jgi:hypothetical protein
MFPREIYYSATDKEQKDYYTKYPQEDIGDNSGSGDGNSESRKRGGQVSLSVSGPLSIFPAGATAQLSAKDLETIKKHQEEVQDQNETKHAQLMSELELTRDHIIDQLRGQKNGVEILALHFQEQSGAQIRAPQNQLQTLVLQSQDRSRAELRTIQDHLQREVLQSREQSTAEIHALEDQLQTVALQSQKRSTVEMRAIQDQLEGQKSEFGEMIARSRERSETDTLALQGKLQLVVHSQEWSTAELRKLQGQLREQKREAEEILRQSKASLETEAHTLRDHLQMVVRQYQEQSKADVRALQEQLQEQQRGFEKQMTDMKEMLAAVLAARP